MALPHTDPTDPTDLTDFLWDLWFGTIFLGEMWGNRQKVRNFTF